MKASELAELPQDCDPNADMAAVVWEGGGGRTVPYWLEDSSEVEHDEEYCSVVIRPKELQE